VAYLLDTNIISDLMRDPDGKVAANIARVGETEVFTSILVSAEIRFGLAKKQSLALSQQFEKILTRLPVLELTPAADETYAELRRVLELRGEPIGATDMFIAAHAISLNYVLATANEREFSRVDGLKLENWLR